jgi:putative lipoprotein
MKRRTVQFVAGAFLSAVASFAPVVAQAAGQIRGTITFRARIAPPPQAVALVSLRDVSLADAPSEEIASVEFRPKNQPALPFVLRYDPKRIHPARTYSVSARILVDGRLAYISTRMYPVITRGASRTADIVVEPVGRSPD